LHAAILDAFAFDDDHFRAFFMNNRAWDDSDAYYAEQFEDDANRRTLECTLASAGLYPDKKFLYMLDFGDEWRFRCRVLKELDEPTNTPEIARSIGDAPQYGD
jgi:hypothetical protein